MRNREHALDFDRYSRTKGWRLSRKIFRRYLIGRYGDFLCDGGKISDDSGSCQEGKNERERERHLKRFEEWRGRAIIEKGFCLSCLASGSPRLPRYFEFSSDAIDPFYGNFWIFTESIQNFFFFIYVYNAENFEFWILNFHRRKFFSIENFESWIRIESSGIIWNICRELYYMESFEERTMNYLWKDYTRVSYVFFVIVTSVRLFVFRPDICTRYFYKCFKSHVSILSIAN